MSTRLTPEDVNQLTQAYLVYLNRVTVILLNAGFSTEDNPIADIAYKVASRISEFQEAVNQCPNLDDINPASKPPQERPTPGV
jgi:hypothetical protein